MRLAPCLWWLSCLPEAAAFWRSTRSVERTQRAVLQRILDRARSTWFGRRHRFGHARDYPQTVPLSHYEDYAEALERIAAGEAAVLTGDRVSLFEPTSGSLGGTKLIPYTAGLKAEFQRALAPWVADLFGRRPALLGGRSYWSISPRPEGAPARWGRISVGFEDDAGYLSRWSGWLVRSMMAVRAEGLPVDFVASTLEQLIGCSDLSLVSVWSPTFWLMLMERLVQDWDAFKRHPHLRERMASAEGHPDGPLAGLWPRLGCISCWGDAYSAGYLPRITERFPRVMLQKKGLIATEAFCTFPLLGREGGALALRSHFFEFIDEHGCVRLAHQLEPNGVYELVVTTSGGLYRYRMGDSVRVVGYVHDCPLLRFEGRRGVVDRFGEKLSLAEVAAALPADLDGRAMLAFETGLRAYTLFAEGATVEHGRRIEERLLQNFHYRYCRQVGQLEAVRVYRLSSATLEPYYARLASLGTRPGDGKPLPLRREADWSEWLPGQLLP